MSFDKIVFKTNLEHSLSRSKFTLMHLQISTFLPEKSRLVPRGTPGLLVTPPHFTLCSCHLIKSGKSLPLS